MKNLTCNQLLEKFDTIKLDSMTIELGEIRERIIDLKRSDPKGGLIPVENSGAIIDLLNSTFGDNIFEILNGKDICYSVCVSSNSFKNLNADICMYDYFILAAESDTSNLLRLSFNKTARRKTVERTLNDFEIDLFKTILGEQFTKVIQDKNGRVYELKNNSFKIKRNEKS